MPRKTVNFGSEASPHFDGPREGIIKDAMGVQIGMKSDVNLENNSTKKSKDKDLEKFEKMTRGNLVDDKN